jgi:hypothetical protein
VPARVACSVSQNGESFTTTFQRFTFFSVTDANKCLAFGPGLIDGGLAGKTSQTMFVIQASGRAVNPCCSVTSSVNVAVFAAAARALVVGDGGAAV